MSSTINNPEHQKLIERIRKLYAMGQAEHSSPHEAEIAMRRCESLMRKFGVSFADLETPEFGQNAVGEQYRQLPSYLGLLASASATMNDCVVLLRKGRIEFKGFAVDAKVAALTYDYLSATLKRSLAERKKLGDVPGGRAAAYDYRIGFASNVLERVKLLDRERLSRTEPSQAQTGVGAERQLVINKRAMIKAECQRMGIQSGKKRQVRYRDNESHALGHSDGASVSLDRQIDANPQKAPKLSSQQ